MTGLLQLCRCFYAVPISMIFLLTICYARGGDMADQWSGAITATIALAMMIMSGHVLNDLFDRKTDRINAPNRPIPSGRVTRKAACILGITLVTCSIAAGATCRPLFLVVLIGIAITLLLYNTFSKQLGFLKGITVALLMISLYPLAFAQAGTITGSRAPSLIIFPIWLFLVTWSFEILKDLRDVTGDDLIRGLPGSVRNNPLQWRVTANAIGLIAAPLLVAPIFMGCRWLFLSIAAIAICVRIVSVFLPTKQAIAAIYAEIFIVGVAATVDVAVLGF